MRKFLLGIVVVSAAWTGCADGDGFSPCESDAACGDGAVCEQGYCVADPLPVVVLAPDRAGARRGDVVRIDGSASSLAGAPVTLEFSVEPADAGELVRTAENLQVAELRILRPHVDLVVTATAASAAGRLASTSVGIAAINSPPRISLRPAAESFGAGDRVELVAEASDPDGDAVTLSWALLSGPGTLDASGARASLATAAGAPARYQVRLDADDGKGGAVYAITTLEPEAGAPTLDIAAPAEVDHFCEGEPLACRAEATVAPVVRASSKVTASWRLLGEGPATASFDVADDLSTRVTLACDPACPLAGSHLLEITVHDHQGRESVGVVELRVGNRPPELRVHDGAGLPHGYVGMAFDGTRLYRVARDADAIVAWHDPDGDPPAPDSIEWSSSDGSVSFDDPRSLSTGFEVIGSAAALEAVELRLVASDWNGGTSVVTGALPIHNGRPTVHMEDLLDEGHGYAAGSPAPYRKLIRPSSIVAADEDGDPLDVVITLPSNARPGLQVLSAGKEWLIGGPASVVGWDHEVVVTARDEWGGEVSTLAKVRITNRAPVVFVAPEDRRVTASTTFGNMNTQCCDPDGTHCTFGKLAVGPGALVKTLPIRVEDPDGDPVDLQLATAQAVDAVAAIASAGGDWREITTEVLCSSERSGSCSATVRMSGRLTTSTGTRCDYASSLLQHSFVFLHASGVDALGARGAVEPILLENP